VVGEGADNARKIFEIEMARNPYQMLRNGVHGVIAVASTWLSYGPNAPPFPPQPGRHKTFMVLRENSTSESPGLRREPKI